MADQLTSDLASLRIDRSPRPPGRPWAWAPWLALLGLAGLAYLAYGKIAPAVFRTEVATTEVVVVSPAQASTELTGTGYVVAQRQSKVACQVLSRISKMEVREGQRVRAGDVLFQVEDAAQRAQLGAARSRALAAEARVEAAVASLTETRQQHAREETLVRAGIGSEATAQDLGERVRALEASLAAARKDAAAAQEDVRAAEVQLAFTTVRAPFDGVVIGKPLDAGELVGTQTEKPAVELCDPATLRAEIDVPEKRLGRIRIGGPAEVVLEAYPETRLRALVEEVGSKVDRSKGTVLVKLKLADEPERLLPDMRARAGFLAEELSAAAAKEPPKTVVPRGAVVERGGAKVVFTLEEGRARMVLVTLGPEMGGGYELRAGPAPGTRVVDSPPETLMDGQPVKERPR